MYEQKQNTHKHDVWYCFEILGVLKGNSSDKDSPIFRWTVPIACYHLLFFRIRLKNDITTGGKNVEKSWQLEILLVISSLIVLFVFCVLIGCLTGVKGGGGCGCTTVSCAFLAEVLLGIFFYFLSLEILKKYFFGLIFCGIRVTNERAQSDSWLLEILRRKLNSGTCQIISNFVLCWKTACKLSCGCDLF